MKCNHCNNEFEEKDLHEHHVWCRFMDNPQGKGMKIRFCKKCHDILHLTIPKIMWKYISNKDDCINDVIKYTLKYGGKEIGLFHR